MARLIDELISRGADDWITAAEVAWVAKSVGGAATDDDARDLAVAVIHAVLEAGLMEAGDVTDGGFFPWDLSAAKSVERIEREWRTLGRSPELGEVCWLANTTVGNRTAKPAHNEDPDQRQ